MVTLNPLDASRQKIARAKTKFSYLVQAVKTLNEGRACKIKQKVQPDGLYVIIRREKEIPDDFSWELVEAVGHLRSALDKICIDLVELNGRGTSGVAFPFGGLDNGKPSPFPDGRIENGIKKKLTPAQWDLVASYKPYPGGNDALWAVNEIANADKHRKGLVSAKAALTSGVGIRRGIIGSMIGNPTQTGTLVYDKERETVAAVIHSAIDLEMELHGTIRVIFGDIAPVAGADVIALLDYQIDMVAQITDACAAFFE